MGCYIQTLCSLDHFIDLLILEDKWVMNITCKAKPLLRVFDKILYVSYQVWFVDQPTQCQLPPARRFSYECSRLLTFWLFCFSTAAKCVYAPALS